MPGTVVAVYQCCTVLDGTVQLSGFPNDSPQTFTTCVTYFLVTNSSSFPRTMFPRGRGIRASYRRPRGRPFEICFLKAGHSSDPSKGLLSFFLFKGDRFVPDS